MTMTRFSSTVLIGLLVVSAAPRAIVSAQTPASMEALHRPLDQILDLYVRDGLVYYRTLKAERGRLDRYAASLNVPAATYDAWSREQKKAFWLNAYNAFVLQTVINNYPMKGRSGTYPASSVRQVPGAFDQRKHRAAGRSVTLDEIEKTILAEFKDPRLYLALGRGAVGSGRLRSEAFTGERLEQQLNVVHAQFVDEQPMLKIDRTAGTVSVTPIVSWREAEFVAAYDKGASGPYAKRSPVERAVIEFIASKLLPLEKELLQKNEFRIVFHPFDWRLNDLTGGRAD
ncbi:MAG TPA: DUF547 domain-containing protein [Vicinamibacterales bacterium]|nr:DUF547 domain-containing protein [Vicinamibacterales bacterium]